MVVNGELFLSAFLQALFQTLMSPDLLQFARREGLHPTLKKWERKLKTIESVLNDAEEKQLTDNDVKMWLDDLQNLAYDVEDILDEFATEALRCKLVMPTHDDDPQGASSSTSKSTAAKLEDDEGATGRNVAAGEVDRKTHAPYVWIIGGLGLGLALIVLSVVLCICLRTSSCFTDTRGDAKDSDGKVRHQFQILRESSFCRASGRYICCRSGDYKQTTREASIPQIAIPKARGTNVFDPEKPVIFTYDEILYSTDGFSDASLLGHGTYGSVYYGVLRNQEVAIKRMTATKSKEFMAEMKILCKVHHTNLDN